MLKNMSKKKNKFPKKAKLITDGGFYKIIKIKDFVHTINVPLLKRVTLATPETNVLDLAINFSVTFHFSKVYRGYAEYRQADIVSTIK